MICFGPFALVIIARASSRPMCSFGTTDDSFLEDITLQARISPLRQNKEVQQKERQLHFIISLMAICLFKFALSLISIEIEGLLCVNKR